MYNMDDEAVSELAKGLKGIVRNARTARENPTESYHRFTSIIKIAEKQLSNLKEGKYRTKATQRMRKPENI